MQVQLRTLPNYTQDQIMVVRFTGNEFIYLYAVAGMQFPGFRISGKLSKQTYLVMPHPGGPFTVDHVFKILLKHFASQVQYFGKSYLVAEKKKQAATGHSDYWQPGAFGRYKGDSISKTEAKRLMKSADLPTFDRHPQQED